MGTQARRAVIGTSKPVGVDPRRSVVRGKQGGSAGSRSVGGRASPSIFGARIHIDPPCLTHPLQVDHAQLESWVGGRGIGREG